MLFTKASLLPRLSSLAVAFVAAACSANGPATQGTGGSSSSGGATGNGGANASGGATANGGANSGQGGATNGQGGANNGQGGSGNGGTQNSNGGSGNGGGSSSGGNAGSSNGGASTGGAQSKGGSTNGGSTNGGSTNGGSNNSGGAAGAATGGASSGWSCPAGPFASNPVPSGATPSKVAGAPTADSFNQDGNGFTNVEGPVWIGDSLYFSEMTTADLPPSRIFKVGPGDAVSIFKSNSGSNGLAVDGAGNIVSANHGAQGIVQFTVPAANALPPLVSTYMSKKFNCPNDLAVKRDGTIYFSDPKHQNGGGTLDTHFYRLPKGSTTAEIIAPDYTDRPNGVTLSLDEKTLFIGGGQGVKKYTVDASGAVGSTGTSFGPSEVTSSGVNTDGMGMDCAGNLYVAVAGSTNVIIVSSTGTKVGQISVSNADAVTNVAFGGTEHKTLYITAQGTGARKGLFKVNLDIPGMPY